MEGESIYCIIRWDSEKHFTSAPHTYEPHMSILEISQKTEDRGWPLPPVIWTSRTDELAESFQDRHVCRLCRHLSPAVGLRPGRGSRSWRHKERLPWRFRLRIRYLGLSGNGWPRPGLPSRAWIHGAFLRANHRRLIFLVTLKWIATAVWGCCCWGW